MKYIDYSIIGEKVLYEKLSNGLNVFIIRKKDYQMETARFFTDFGGKDIEFIPYNKNEFIKVPAGVAHFLEHKLFEMEDGTPAECFYKKTGSFVNAFTNYDTTCYYFSCTNSFEKNLTYLLDFVQSPYFTDENIEKERGIILEEAKSYLDNPNRVFYERIMENLFHNIPYNKKVIGSLDDIKNISKEDINNCYNTFYHPSNMTLLVVTNKKEEDILKIIKDNQDKKDFKKINDVVKKEYDEPLSVKREMDIINYNVNEKRICYALKLDLKSFKDNRSKIIDSIGIYLDYLVGDLSTFNLELKKKRIITSNMDVGINVFSDFVIVKIMSFVNDENKFISLLEEKLKSKEEISEKDFTMLKKSIISSVYYRLDKVDGVMNFFYSEYINYKELNPENLKEEKELNYSDFSDIIKKIDINNKSITIMKRENENEKE